MKKISMLAVVFAAGLFVANAQVKTPRPSPNAEVEQELGLTEVEVKYSRPSVKGRTIFGDLVPYGTMWRTGANSPTIVDFDDKVMVEGNEIEKGKYAMFTIPGKDKWTVIFNSNTKKNAWEYDESTEAARFEVTPSKLAQPVESFTIGFDNLRDASCSMYMAWENTKVSFNIEVNTDEAVMATIEKTMAGPEAYDKYLAARYYYENDKDLKKALTWVTEACDAMPDKYWMLKWKAEIQAANGLTKEAIATAEKSKTLAAEAYKQGYVKMNEENIAKWKKK